MYYVHYLIEEDPQDLLVETMSEQHARAALQAAATTYGAELKAGDNSAYLTVNGERHEIRMEWVA